MFNHIRRIDFEFQSYCNRECDWCPNKDIKRDFHEEMIEETYLQFLMDLSKNNFGARSIFYNYIDIEENSYNETSPYFSFSGYQEPFSNLDLLRKRAEQAYNILPSTIEISANTNGDFLTKDSLEDLYLTNISIMDYDNKGIEHWVSKFKELNIAIVDINYNTEIISGMHRFVNQVTCQCNWIKHASLENRGGFFKREDLKNVKWNNEMQERDFPCIEPSYYLTINYNGDVMPCCHMRHDNLNHKEFIMGNINEKSITEIYMSDKFIEFRQQLGNQNLFPEVCKYCQKRRYERFEDSFENIRYNGLLYLNK